MAQATEQGGTDGLTDQVSAKAQEAASAVQEKTSELREEGTNRLRDQLDRRSSQAGTRHARSPRRSAGRATSWRARATRPRSSSPPRPPTASSGSAATWSGRAGTSIFARRRGVRAAAPVDAGRARDDRGHRRGALREGVVRGPVQGNAARADAGARPDAAAGAADRVPRGRLVRRRAAGRRRRHAPRRCTAGRGSGHGEATGDGQRAARGADRHVAKDLTSDLALLVRQEIDLAKAEMAQKGRAAGPGIAMVGAGGATALCAAGAATAFLVLVFSTRPAGLGGGAISTVVLAAVAFVLVRQGKERAATAGAPIPEQTIETVKEDVEWARTRASSARK